MAKSSPRVSHHSWGRIDVEGVGPFKDVKLYPGGARAWNWSETGTRHVPGVQYADAAELLDLGAEHVVLSTGVHERLQVSAAVVAELEAHGVTVHVAPTPAAIRLYNTLAVQHRVGALLHSTC